MDIFEKIVTCAGTDNVLKKSDGFKEAKDVMNSTSVIKMTVTPQEYEVPEKIGDGTKGMNKIGTECESRSKCPKEA